MKLSGAEILCESLQDVGVEVIFGLPGGAMLPVYDAMSHYPQLRHVLVRHEQGAAHAAEGYARATGKVGVCMSTSGPGATNLVTGIADAYMDSVPVVAITGQVARPLIGKDAFQEIDITGITLPITKHNYLVSDAGSIARIIKEAFYLASSGRPGPVLIDLPRDVQSEMAEYIPAKEPDLPGYKPMLYGHPAQIKRAAKLVNESLRPVIIAGHGVLISGADKELQQFAQTAQIPVVTTMLGIGSFPASHVLSCGWLGMHGATYANLAVSEADLVIAIGMRFDDRATADPNRFAPRARIIHIDIDPAEIGKNVRVDVPIVGDAKNVLIELNEQVASTCHSEWLRQIDEWRGEHPLMSVSDGGDSLLPQFVVGKIYELSGREVVVVTGVGQNQMWAAQYYQGDQSGCFISSGGLGTMGFELPASLGAQIGRPESLVWCIAGDGGFQMTMQELATVVQEHAAVKIAILNNGYLGMVRQWQELFYGRRYLATTLSGPDFVKVAEAYGIRGLRVSHREEVVPAIEQAIAEPGAFLLDFRIEPEANVYPMIPPGASLAQPLPMPEKGVRLWPQRSTL